MSPVFSIVLKYFLSFGDWLDICFTIINGFSGAKSLSKLDYEEWLKEKHLHSFITFNRTMLICGKGDTQSFLNMHW
jgi:hypothetical protein